MDDDLDSIELKVIDTILKWAIIAKESKRIVYADNGTTFSIRWNFFWPKNDIRIFKHIEDILDKLKEENCFEGWEKNPYASAEKSEFVFKKVNIAILQALHLSYTSYYFSPNTTVGYDYERKKLFFKIKLRPTDIDFSNALAERKVIESFWKLREKEYISVDEIIKSYKEVNNENIEQHYISQIVSNINKRVRRNELINDRFTLKFLRDRKLWYFQIK